MIESNDMTGTAPVEERENPHSLGGIIEALSSCVQNETTALANRNIDEIQAFSIRKSRLLFELMRAVRTTPEWAKTPGAAGALEILSESLKRNARQIEAQIYAVREVSNMMIHEIKDNEADGTYSAASLYAD